MTETVITIIQIAVFIIALIMSIGVGIRLRKNAEAHEQQAKKLDKEVRREINL